MSNDIYDTAETELKAFWAVAQDKAGTLDSKGFEDLMSKLYKRSDIAGRVLTGVYQGVYLNLHHHLGDTCMDIANVHAVQGTTLKVLLERGEEMTNSILKYQRMVFEACEETLQETSKA